MSLRDELNALTPRLRRYARALATGGPAHSELADELVRATLMRALGARSVGGANDLAIRLYATITQLHRDMAVVGRSAMAVGVGRPALVSAGGGVTMPSRHTKLSAGLLALPLDHREALLLVTLEGFGHGDAARILRISRGVLIGRLTEARTALDGALQTRSAPKAVAPARNVPYLRLVT